jgi:homocitrate synthase NifV
MTARLVDTTLREGAQAPVPYLSGAQKAAVLAAVARIGVAEIELGHAVTELAYGAEPLADLMGLAADFAPGVRRAIWCRARSEDIRSAAALQPEVVSFALPVSDRHLSTRLHRDRAWALGEIGRLVTVARESGVGYVSLGLEDASRADVAFLLEVVEAADAAGADRVRIADTVGVLSPGLLAELISAVRARFSGEIGVHLHNDFGMATAGAIAASEAGASWADVSLLGLGERAGISRTEEVAAFFTLQNGEDYDLLAARAAAEMISEWVRRPIPAQAPVIGEGIFTAESGLHVAGLAADPANYEPYAPEIVGAKRSLRLGRNSGRAAVAALLGERRGDLVKLTAKLRSAAESQQHSFAADELDELLTNPGA